MLLCLSMIAIESADNPDLGSLLWTWSFPPLPFSVLSLTVLVYLMGWRVAHRTRPRELPPWRAASFIAGIAALWIALASPIDALDDFLLIAHMIQHFGESQVHRCSTLGAKSACWKFRRSCEPVRASSERGDRNLTVRTTAGRRKTSELRTHISAPAAIWS